MADGKPRLTYTPGRGLAEVTRLALVAGGIEYEDVYLTSRDAFLQLINDGKLLFNQIPLLEMDGICLVGSEALLRYVCNKAGLMGKTDQDQAMIEMLTLGARDLLKSGLPNFKFSPPEKQEEILQNIAKQSRERYLPVFEKMLAANKSGFLVGDSLTMADLAFFDPISYFDDIPVLKEILTDFPQCKAFVDNISQQPGIRDYLSSPRRFPLPNEDYVREVRRNILNQRL